MWKKKWQKKGLLTNPSSTTNKIILGKKLMSVYFRITRVFTKRDLPLSFRPNCSKGVYLFRLPRIGSVECNVRVSSLRRILKITSLSVVFRMNQKYVTTIWYKVVSNSFQICRHSILSILINNLSMVYFNSKNKSNCSVEQFHRDFDEILLFFFVFFFLI